jgi:hypothetical protein
LSLDAVHRSFSQDPDLCAALGIGKAKAVFSAEPGSLQSQRLHPPESKHEADGRERGRLLTFRCRLAHHAPEVTESAFTQWALPCPDGELPDAFRGIPSDDAETSSKAEQRP